MLYLSARDLSSLDITTAESIGAIEGVFRARAEGEFESPPKIWMDNPGLGFVSSMACQSTRTGWAAVKWQSASEQNVAEEKDYLNGVLILSEGVDGCTRGPVCIMDAGWISAVRTPAASAVAVRYLGPENAGSLAIVGCGRQGREHVKVLREVMPCLDTVLAYDVREGQSSVFAQSLRTEMGIACVECESPVEAVSRASVAVTGGRISRTSVGRFSGRDIGSDSLLICLDYDSYVSRDALLNASGVVCDDIDQLEHLRQQGYFQSVPSGLVELESYVCGERRMSGHAGSYSVCMLLGIAPEDLALAELAYRRAVQRDAGVCIEL